MTVLREVLFEGELLILLPDGNYLVMSSKPQQWYYVTKEGTCGCKGYQFSKKEINRCRHSKVVIRYAGIERRRRHHDDDFDEDAEIAALQHDISAAKQDLLHTFLNIDLE